MADSKVVVVVRARGIPGSDASRNAACCLKIKDNSITCEGIQGNTDRTFTFDCCFASHLSRDDPAYATQEVVFDKLGSIVLGHAWNGFNCSVFAYGQTGSGKTYTMMGNDDGCGFEGSSVGLIPRTCRALFSQIQDRVAESRKAASGEDGKNVPPSPRRSGGLSDENMFKVSVSYLEIYNEKVRDLLPPPTASSKPPSKAAAPLRVRLDPKKGPYVEGLTQNPVHHFSQLEELMARGNQLRTVASTAMNQTSSRSHAIYTLEFTQTQIVDDVTATDRVSRISFVDLAGSERADKTGASGATLREGSNINRSLSVLGKVINALADLGKAKGSKQIDTSHIPYRDSVLTWLLKESLGGNAKTVMLATVTSSSLQMTETLGTLRYAERAKRVVTHATVNEDPNQALIRELREEIDQLRAALKAGTGAPGAPVAPPPPPSPRTSVAPPPTPSACRGEPAAAGIQWVGAWSRVALDSPGPIKSSQGS